ncbi:exo-alpha-sialidase [Mucilaginibacter myungsuensis]|uniref:Exo-alpha-sialidase n=2 Tax=Mucilaginibacter myungsuensis TaxID=649104 RepID=A0A929PUV3_9SPHI|nr:exo-alpha-sialidase [Mucilaginibacter myungsuensis]
MKIKKMKKLFVFAPAILLVVFLLNSFVLTEREPKKKPVKKEVKSSVVSNVIFRSDDGGQTWTDISAGLPEGTQRTGLPANGLLANEGGLYIRTGNGIYHNGSNAATSNWTKENFPGNQRNITLGNNGILAYDLWGKFLKKANGTNNWSPMYTDFQKQAVRIDSTMDWMYKNYKMKEVRTAFETAKGTVLIGSSNSLFRSANAGKTWQQLHVGNGRMQLVESDGVLLTTSKDGIFRSADDGQNWERVVTEGGLGVAVERIDGGFAAILNNPINETNSLHISMDNGKTWSNTGKDLQASWVDLMMTKMGIIKYAPAIISVKQTGKYLVCGCTNGIFRSTDMGKTWEKLSLPAVENMGFNLTASGDVIYVMPNKGC